MRQPTLEQMHGYPWQEHVWCRRCDRLYRADYRQDRDWSACPDCTGEAGKPCRNVAALKTLEK